MYKKIIMYAFIIIILITGIFLLFYFSNTNSIIRKFEKTFQLNLPKDTHIIFSENNHGALGDGASFYIYQINSIRMSELLSQSNFTKWKSMPMDTDMYLEVYKRIEDISTFKMYITKIFHIKGYYMIRNRYDIPLEENEFFDYSYNNIVIGIIDIENSIIYYLKLDK